MYKYMLIPRRSYRKWVVYVASCLVPFLDFALALTFGSMFVHLLDRYGENRATTATVHSILLGTATIASVMSGILIRKIGVARVSFIGSALLSGGFIFSFFARSIIMLDVFIGAFGGLGISFIYVSSTVVARNSFEGSARDIAVSANNVCAGIGSTLYPYVVSLFMSTFTVNETFLILGGIFLNNFVISLLFLSNERGTHRAPNGHLKGKENEDAANQNNGEECKATAVFRMRNTLKSLWNGIVTLMHVRYVFVLIGAGLTMSATSAYLVVFNDIYAGKQFTEDESLMLFSLYHACSTAARVLPIVVTKLRPGSDLMILLTSTALCGSIGQLCILFSSQVSAAIVGNILTGVAQGGVISAATVAVAKLSTKESFSVAFGLLFTVIGILTILNGIIYGYIRDSVKSYDLAVILTATMSGVAACLFIATPVFTCCQRPTAKPISEDAQPSPVDGIACVSLSHKTYGIDKM